MNILFEFQKKPLVFNNPAKIISCFEPDRLEAAFAEMEEALKQGYYLAGFIAYEAGYAFEEKLLAKTHRDFPLLHIGCYSAPLVRREYFGNKGEYSTISNLRKNITKANYSANIQKIRHFIEIGDVYQITYCIKMLFDFDGSPYNLYRRLLESQAVPYPAYIETKKFHIISLSPEMFLFKKGNFLATKPMKGTWPRHENFFLDIFSPLCLKYDRKNRAENVMIADLLRNDLGRIGKKIRAPKLFEVAKYRTLAQMTSTVTAWVNKDLPLYDLFKAVFPSGSVTGAPRIRAMQIIRDIENEERKIYTGAIGYITPQKDIFFNIPIRTVLLENGRGEMGIGGGIVWDSTSEGEWQEGDWKAKFLVELSQA